MEVLFVMRTLLHSKAPGHPPQRYARGHPPRFGIRSFLSPSVALTSFPLGYSIFTSRRGKKEPFGTVFLRDRRHSLPFANHRPGARNQWQHLLPPALHRTVDPM